MINRLTIFTPTFNRFEHVKNLFFSICKQTFTNFTWIVIDDGSITKETYNFFKQLEGKTNFKLIYIYQENLGKYVAYNNALKFCETEYFCCIDDDDVVDCDFVETIYNSLPNEQDIIGILFPRNSSVANQKKDFVDVPELWLIDGIKTETTIVVKTEVAKRNLFPIFTNEKFASEEIVYIKYSHFGKFKFINKPLVKSSYLDNGLTSNLFKLWRNNVCSSYALFYSRYNYLNKFSLISRIFARYKCLSNYYSVVIFNKKIPKFNRIGNCIYFIPCYLTGFLLYIFKKNKLY